MGIQNGIGASTRRSEDLRFTQGKGQYTDDLQVQNQTHVIFVRSDQAHATIKSINTTHASQAPGVVAIFTGADIALAGLGGIPCGWQITDKHGEAMKEPPHPILAHGKVRHVGDPVVGVIADTIDQATHAASLIAIEYDSLPSVVDMHSALNNPSALVHDELGDNLCYDWALGEEAEVDAQFAKADHVTTLEFINNRLVPNAMEPRAAIGDYNDATGKYTLYTTSQNPHVIRLLMGAFVLSIPEHKLRVVAPDVGGGFGSKIYHYAEEAFVTWASAQILRPVRWCSTRSEAFISDAHGRDHATKAKLALDANGNFLGLKVDTMANMGAYLSTFAPCIPTWLHATLLAGQYKTPVVYCNVRAVFTNTVPVDAYRGAGRPEATYLLERIIDKAAREMGIDQAEIRRRNLIGADQFPYQTPVALQYDIGDYHATLDKVMAMADYDNFDKRRAQSAAKGKLRGMGLSCYIEACGIAPSSLVGALGARAGLYEAATVRVNPTGSISVFTGSHSHGQGHETTFAQIVAEHMGVPFDQIEIVHGDTDRIPFGMGTYGSRSLAVGGSAIIKAIDKIVAKAKKIAAHMLEADAGDIDYEDGEFRVRGTDRTKAFAEIALAAYVPHQYPLEELEPGLEENAFYDPANFTFPAGAYICDVEIDPDTGVVDILNWWAADDFGNIINPMIVEGQVHGGLAQGIGQAMLETAVYNGEGQLINGSFMDYTMPRASDLPNFNVTTNTTACTHNPLGVKGCGEAGAIGAPPCVVNAVLDALRDYGIAHIDMPLTPPRIWQAIQDAKK